MEEITYYQHFTDTCPVKTTMENIVRLIRDDETVAAKTAAHRADPEAGHKRTCPLFAVAGIMEGGKAESNIVAMTGLAMVDVDHVSSQEGGGSQPLETLFGRLCGDPHTLLCYRTISGDGIRVVFRYGSTTAMTWSSRSSTTPGRSSMATSTTAAPMAWRTTRNARTWDG